MSDHYILDGHRAIKTDLMTWASWFENVKDRHVADEKVGDVRVSTVFLGLDHAWGGNEPPQIFETMVFGGELDQEMDRYSTWEQAEIGHQNMVDRVKQVALKMD
jgi:hypothetical protein